MHNISPGPSIVNTRCRAQRPAAFNPTAGDPPGTGSISRRDRHRSHQPIDCFNGKRFVNGNFSGVVRQPQAVQAGFILDGDERGDWPAITR